MIRVTILFFLTGWFCILTALYFITADVCITKKELMHNQKHRRRTIKKRKLNIKGCSFGQVNDYLQRKKSPYLLKKNSYLKGCLNKILNQRDVAVIFHVIIIDKDKTVDHACAYCPFRSKFFFLHLPPPKYYFDIHKISFIGLLFTVSTEVVLIKEFHKTMEGTSKLMKTLGIKQVLSVYSVLVHRKYIGCTQVWVYNILL